MLLSCKVDLGGRGVFSRNCFIRPPTISTCNLKPLITRTSKNMSPAILVSNSKIIKVLSMDAAAVGVDVRQSWKILCLFFHFVSMKGDFFGRI